MSEDKLITMEITTFIRYKDECYEVGEVIKNLLNKLEEKDKEIKRLNNIIDKYKKMSFVHEIDLQNRIKEVRKYIKNPNINVSTIRYNDIVNVKDELLKIIEEVE